jgi:hypothetical protein
MLPATILLMGLFWFCTLEDCYYQLTVQRLLGVKRGCLSSSCMWLYRPIGRFWVEKLDRHLKETCVFSTTVPLLTWYFLQCFVNIKSCFVDPDYEVRVPYIVFLQRKSDILTLIKCCQAEREQKMNVFIFQPRPPREDPAPTRGD